MRSSTVGWPLDSLPDASRGALDPSLGYGAEQRGSWRSRSEWTKIGPGTAPHDIDGKGLYPGMAEKAAALGFSVIKNHPFVDGNKRVGHAAMETFLLLKGFEINASVEDQEKVILGVASGAVERRELVDWLHNHIIEAHHD